MTHTLHRSCLCSTLDGDYVVFALAAQGFNSKGATPKLQAILDILKKHEPLNLSNGVASVFTGRNAEQLREESGETAYPAAVYTDRETLENVLRDLKEADLGMSVVLAGDYRQLLESSRSAGLTPHTIHLSIGVHGRTEKLPEPEIQDIATMCGHALIPPARISQLAESVAKGKMSAREAGLDLARGCSCGVFNPDRAADLINKYIAKGSEGQ